MGGIKAVIAGYLGDSKLWYMASDGKLEVATIGAQVEHPYLYMDARPETFGVLGSTKETVRVLFPNEVREMDMWKVEIAAPSLARSLRAKGRLTAEDDIAYLERRLGADGQFEWVQPERISFMDIETDRKTGTLELIGSVVNGKYESFSNPLDYFQAMMDGGVAAATAWNGDKFDFRILDAVKGKQSAYWRCMRHIDSMELYSKFSQYKTRRGLDAVARREGIGQKLEMPVSGTVGYAQRMRDYNENDCRIMESIIKKGDLVGTECELAELTGIMPSPNNLRAIALFENYLMKNREKYRLWLSGGRGYSKATETAIQGALVLYAEPGIYDGVDMLDFSGLYPSVVMYNDYHGDGEQVWKVTQRLLKEWIALKDENGRLGNKSKREAYKTLANGSGYGIFASNSFRYSSRAIASYITYIARGKLMEMRKIVEDMGFVPLVSDSVMEGTPLLIKRNGEVQVIRIEDTLVGDLVVDETGWTAVKQVIAHEVDKRIYGVETDAGYVEVTVDHSIINREGKEVSPSRLKVGDLVARIPYGALGLEQNAKAVTREEATAFGRYVSRDKRFKPSKSIEKAISECRDSKGEMRIPPRMFRAGDEATEAFLDGFCYREETGEREITETPEIAFGVYMLAKKAGMRSRYLPFKASPLFTSWVEGMGAGVDDFAVTGITNLGAENCMVYDLETESHHFMAGGVLLHNTDSVSVQAPKDKTEALLRVVNKRLSPYHVKEEYYARRFLMFGGVKEGGATKKRYAALTEDGELVVKGLETVRSDWSPWARDFQRKLLMVALSAPLAEVTMRVEEAALVEREKFFGGSVPVEDVAITKSIDLEKEYKVKTQQFKAYQQLEQKGLGLIGFVTYWQSKKPKKGDSGIIVRNQRTDEDIKNALDWDYVWQKQAEPIVKRLRTCYTKRETGS